MAFFFDATKVQPAREFTLLPNGQYAGVVVKSELRGEEGEPQTLWLEHEVIQEGEYFGRKLWIDLRMAGYSQASIDYAARILTSLCRAINEDQVNDEQILCNKPVMINVKVKPADGQYKAKNEISSYEAFKNVMPARAAPQPARPAPAAPVAPAAPAGKIIPSWQQRNRVA